MYSTEYPIDPSNSEKDRSETLFPFRRGSKRREVLDIHVLKCRSVWLVERRRNERSPNVFLAAILRGLRMKTLLRRQIYRSIKVPFLNGVQWEKGETWWEKGSCARRRDEDGGRCFVRAETRPSLRLQMFVEPKDHPLFLRSKGEVLVVPKWTEKEVYTIESCFFVFFWNGVIVFLTKELPVNLAVVDQLQRCLNRWVPNLPVFQNQKE